MLQKWRWCRKKPAKKPAIILIPPWSFHPQLPTFFILSSTDLKNCSPIIHQPPRKMDAIFHSFFSIQLWGSSSEKSLLFFHGELFWTTFWYQLGSIREIPTFSLIPKSDSEYGILKVGLIHSSFQLDFSLPAAPGCSAAPLPPAAHPAARCRGDAAAPLPPLRRCGSAANLHWQRNDPVAS